MKQFHDIVPHGEHHRTLMQPIKKSIRCTLQKLEDGDWKMLDTCSVDASELVYILGEVERLQKHAKLIRRRAHHRKASVTQELMDVYERVSNLSTKGEKLQTELKQRVCDAINHMLEVVNNG